jgi:hypothetical protein
MSERTSSGSTGQTTVSCDDQWVTWMDDASEIEWAGVALARFGAVASYPSSTDVRVVSSDRASR